MTSKYLTSICLILGSIIPIIVDTGHTHLFNVDWDEHSRVHEVWRLVTNLSIAIVGLYILWFKNYLFLPAILSTCIIFGFFIAVISMPLYDGLAIGEGIQEPNPFGIPANIFLFMVIGTLQFISILILLKKEN
tara:strand:- start:383 stop:781 length:399 start_codon:yes stop_codon:yes gene_type:complete